MRMNVSRSVAILVAVGLALGLVEAGKTPEIFLPPDTNVVEIFGSNFRIKVEQFTDIKESWNKASEEAVQVENPRRENEDHVAIDDDLFERTKEAKGDVSYGVIDDELLRWIENRATELIDRIDVHLAEIRDLKDAERIVADILFLNTLVDLENLSKETEVLSKANSKLLKRIRIKLRQLSLETGVHSKEVRTWISMKIKENLDMERRMKGTNKPHDKWLVNVNAIMRIRHEQRFSQQISSLISNYLGGKLSMMTRLRVYEMHKTADRSNDILYYKAAKGRVPSHFPFSSQYAISKGQ